MKINQFLATIVGLSPNTQRAYKQTLWQVQSRIKGDEPIPDEILSFLKPYSVASLHRHKAAIKAYLEFMGRGWPFSSRQFSPRRRHIPRYVPTSVVEEITAASNSEDDKMFVATLFTLGCRISELLRVRPEDITPAGVRMLTKGGEEKLKPITKEFYSKLSGYAERKRGKLFPEPYSYYYLKLRELGTKVGHPEVTPHMLRHARAVDLLRKGMPLPFVQQFLQHRSIQTTAIYLELTGGELAQELEKVEA
jgi:integrase